MNALRADLRKTRALLAAAVLFAILPAAFVTFREWLEYVFPSCSGTLESVDTPLSTSERSELQDALVLDEERGGLRLRLDTDLALDGSVVGARVIRVGRDARGRRCECGRVVLRDAGVSARGGEVRHVPSGALVYVDARWGPSWEAFRAVERPTRHLQRDRLFARHDLPAALALLAIGATAFAALRTRKAVGYVKEQHSWIEARLQPDGRVEAENGSLLGVVDGEVRALAPAALLVAPDARERNDAYRDVPLLARRHLALGSHDEWRRGTARAFRTARSLAAISTACAVVALVVSLRS
jgi:hypothetical protein